jgi:hypothetical protein
MCREIAKDVMKDVKCRAIATLQVHRSIFVMNRHVPVYPSVDPHIILYTRKQGKGNEKIQSTAILNVTEHLNLSTWYIDHRSPNSAHHNDETGEITGTTTKTKSTNRLGEQIKLSSNPKSLLHTHFMLSIPNSVRLLLDPLLLSSAQTYIQAMPLARVYSSRPSRTRSMQKKHE